MVGRVAGRARRIEWRCEGCEKDGRSCDGGDVGADEREEGRHGIGWGLLGIRGRWGRGGIASVDIAGRFSPALGLGGRFRGLGLWYRPDGSEGT